MESNTNQRDILEELNLNDLNELIKFLDQKRKELAEQEQNDFEM